MNENNNCIKCDAKNCIHHSQSDYCMADQIKIGYDNSCCTSETACMTFKVKG